MFVEERCVHQGVDIGRHALFNEQWERCKNCSYNPEENKKCTGYSKTAYNLPNKKPVSERNLKEYKGNFDVVITNDSDMNLVNEFIREIKA